MEWSMDRRHPAVRYDILVGGGAHTPYEYY